jgi:F-type H+-transporting ATPase subunit b
MRATMIRGLLALGALFWLGSVVRAEDKPPEPQKPKYDYHKKDGKEETAVLDPADAKSVMEFADRLKEGAVGEIDLEKPPPFLSIKWDLGLWTLVVFLGLFFILSKVAWKPMLEGLKNREESIARALTEAEAARRETAELRTRLQAEINKAQEQARDIIAEASRGAQRTAEEMIAKAKAEIAAERDRLHRELTAAKDQALKELFDYAANLATLVSSKAVRRQLNEDDHRRLVDEALSEMRGAAGRFSAN